MDTLSLLPSTTALKYDAVQSGPRRRAVYVSSRSEDRELPVTDRQSLISQGRDLMRNLTLVGFAIRKHLQYVASFDFKCSIPGQPAYNELVKRWMYRWSRREHCDLARRHCLKELITLIETHRVLDGDVGILKHANGRLQLIEGDRIRNPPGHVDVDYEWVHGVKIGKTGQAFKYAISKRQPGGGFEHEREVQADNLILCGYYTRADQVRGVPPLAPAIITFQHVYEGIDYALAKAKLSQMLGLLTKTEDDLDLEPDERDSEAEDLAKAVREKFGPGTLHLNFRPSDDAKLLGTEGTPSNEFQAFVIAVTRIAFAALDIPYSMFDGSLATFYGVRGELDGYIEGCKTKQIRLVETLNDVTDWRLRLAIADGELPPPPDGMSVDAMLWYCDWIGAGLPLWRLIEDTKGYTGATRNGYLTSQKICSMHGGDFGENLDELAEAKRAAEERGLTLDFMLEPGKANFGQ